MIIPTTELSISTAPRGVYNTHTDKQRLVSPQTHNSMCTVSVCVSLTRHSSSEAFLLTVEESLSELCLPAAGRTNQCNRPLPIGRLVVQSHLLIGENLIVFHIWANGKKGMNYTVMMRSKGKTVGRRL